MFKSLLSIHRFLLSQAFYPLLLSSALALTMYFGRVVFSGRWIIYANLVWNLFLAWIPYSFSMLAVGLTRSFPKHWWMLIIPGVIWLVFFPNAAYILTDFTHLAPREGISIWYDMLLLTTFAWTGVFLAMASLRTMQRLVKSCLGLIVSWLFAAVALGLTSLGIYLGRFERWNSWDLLFHPRSILADIATRFADPLDNLRFFGFTLLFTAFLVVCYLMFASLAQSDGVDSALVSNTNSKNRI
jgi:uncharacterized membrane protein